jgi:hypothetical protein
VIVFGIRRRPKTITEDAFTASLQRATRAGQTLDNQKGGLFRVAHNLAINPRSHERLFDPPDANDFDEPRRQMPDTAPGPFGE